MSVDELEDVEGDGETADKPKLKLDVEIASPSACERHLTVTIPREDIDRYYDDAFSKMMPEATVPGFRPGRAPRKLIEQKFRKEVTDQIKLTLLMDSIEQLSEERELTAIGEPIFDLEAVEIPSEGPMTYEFDLEVRPEFEMPEWRGLTIERPVRDLAAADIDKRLESILSQYGRLAPYEGAAEANDFLVLNVFTSHEGKRLASREEVQVRLRPTLSFHDSNIEGFDKRMEGVKAGEKREIEVELSAGAPNEALAGKQVSVEFEVLDVKRLELPELTPEFLKEMGGFETVEALRAAVESDLRRQLGYQQQQRARRQVSAALTESANWDLPPGLLKRQSAREMERAVLELRRNGFGEEEIQAMRNQLRQNSSQLTAKALKEHFILERLAEMNDIEANEDDYDAEVRLIAAQTNDSPRRVRAQLEKRDLLDALRNQIIERKAIDLVLEQAKFKDVPFDLPENKTTSIDMAAGGGEELVGAAESQAAADD